MNRYAPLLLLLPLLLGYYSKPQKNKPRKGKDYALLFATEQYADKKLQTLKYPIANATDIKTELETTFGFECRLVTNPSVDDIIQWLEKYKNNFDNGTFDKDGQLFIFFTGHGERKYGNGYFLTKNTETSRLETTAFPYGIGRNIINEMACKHILVAIDACKSGSFDPASERGDMFGTRGNETSDADKLIQSAAKLKTRRFVSSGAMDANTPDKSEFAYHFLSALRSHGNVQTGKSDNILTLAELNIFLESATPKPTIGKFGDDEASSNFLFITAESPPSGAGGGDVQKEAEVWQNTTSQNTLYAYQEYLRQYPNGDFTSQARRKITELEKQEELNAWARAKAQNTQQAYQTFLDRYPLSIYAETAKERIKPDRLPFEPEMVTVQGGTFEMGCTKEQGTDCGSDEKPAHQVSLNDFSIGKYEVTQKQWRDIMGSDLPKLNFKGCDNCPVESVSWDDIQGFLKKLNQKTGKNYDLPTEAEWEYAARGGNQSKKFKYSGSNTIDEVAWYTSNSDSKTHPVGSKKANELGIYDMSGNVCEWCRDKYAGYGTKAINNPTGAVIGSNRIIRSGGWVTSSGQCRVTARISNSHKEGYSILGFRVALDSK